MALPSILQGVGAAASLAGTVSGIVGGRKAAKASKTANRRALAVAEGSLRLAQQQFNMFAPVLKQFSDLYQQVPLSDIVSGRVISPEVAAQVSSINDLAAQREQQLNQNLAQRGISNTTAGQSLRILSDVQRGRDVQRTIASGVRQEIADRRSFAQGALSSLQNVQGASNQVSGVLSRQADQQLQLSGQQAAAAGQAASTLGAILSREDPLSTNSRILRLVSRNTGSR